MGCYVIYLSVTGPNAWFSQDNFCSMQCTLEVTTMPNWSPRRQIRSPKPREILVRATEVLFGGGSLDLKLDGPRRAATRLGIDRSILHQLGFGRTYMCRTSDGRRVSVRVEHLEDGGKPRTFVRVSQ